MTAPLDPTLAGELRTMLARVAAPAASEDLSRYRTDPVAYVHERLGYDTLPHQECFMYAVAGQWDRITPEMAALAHLTNPGKRKIAVTSGQKTGKSFSLTALALWFFECFEKSKTLMTAAIGDQIRAVLWTELKRLLREAKSRPPEKPYEDPASGLISTDESREIRGFTGRTIEAVAGRSGNILYEVDEASHLDQKKAEAIEGNTAGGGDLDAPIVYTSQPTQDGGPFFDAFHSKAEFWTTMTFDSEEIAEYQASTGRQIPGMATRARIRLWREEYGEDSPFYQVRVRGRFLRNETGRIVPMHRIEEARARWREAADPDEVLAIGFDPAGPGDAGDELGFAPVRGAKCLELYTRRGLDEERGLAEVYHLLEKHRRPGETPRVMLDAEGKIGAAYYGRLRAEAERRRTADPATAFEVYGVRTSSRFVRERDKFARVRDEVWWNLAQWMLTGAIPLDHKLEAELHAPMWHSMPDGKIRATGKDDLRDYLGRSPDRADALALAVDPPRAWRPPEDDERAPAPTRPERAHDERLGGVDPYAWERTFRSAA